LVPADGRCLPAQQPKPFEGRHDLLSDTMVAPLGSSVSTLESRMSHSRCSSSIRRISARWAAEAGDPDPLHLNPGEIRQEAMAGSTTNQDGPHHLAGVGQQNRDPRSQTAPTPSMNPTAGAGCPFKRKAIGSLARWLDLHRTIYPL
jgi:hypothetical protein